ncbi:hypothetical protein JQC72_14740 [Polycladomyces sp. WAk]|uniref:DUF4304 domain-containing protein n=1 Tax=Polycladomyces zharkentensis TaxID=2807616 RepID=A0ABS2WN98_9BACL|nr:hypothetical protein [Polycladomyces sp. WAk]MBN2910755.1 hypothetical protein [Polycladomyces sp. WAk]
MDHNTRMLVKQAIDEEQEATIQKFRTLIQYPFHPDAKFVELEIRGNGGVFGVTCTQMDENYGQLMHNAYGEPDNDLPTFGFYLYSKLDKDRSEIRDDEELVEEIDEFAKEYFVSFFQRCFNAADGKKSPIPIYLFYPNSGDSYDLKQEKWVEME